MNPAQLAADSFRNYPPEARGIASQNLQLLRGLPLSFLALLLREVIAYDRKFPAERRELDHQLAYLSSLPEQKRHALLSPFHALQVTPALEELNWVDEPARFSEALSAHLWSTHQIDIFRTAAVHYMDECNSGWTIPAPAQHRLVMVAMGKGVHQTKVNLFRKLRRHGTLLTNVNPEGGLATLQSWLQGRAASMPEAHAHWNISGGEPSGATLPGITQISYSSLAAPRAAMRRVLRNSFESGVGAEALRTKLASMTPADIGLTVPTDPAALWFQLSLLSEGSGTQVYSTTFVQWATREALRRAQPATMLCQFAPRQRTNSTKDLLAEQTTAPVLDPEGSLVDADMAAYQTWINLQRLPGARDARFLAWFEGHREMLVVGPGATPGVVLEKATTFEQVAHELLQLPV